MKKPHKLINWAELSRLLNTSRDSIRPRRIPEKHRKKIEDLIQVIQQWKSRWSDELKKD